MPTLQILNYFAILGSYLGIAPGEVQFDYQPRGKPVLAEKFAKSGVSDRQMGKPHLS